MLITVFLQIELHFLWSPLLVFFLIFNFTIISLLIYVSDLLECLFCFCFFTWDFSIVNYSALFVIFGAGRLGFAKFGARSLAVVDDNNFEYDDNTIYKGQFYVIDTLGNVSWINNSSLIDTLIKKGGG